MYITCMLSISTIIKGFIVGATMMVPGVSGGSMAMVLGLYDKLINSLGHIFDSFKSNFIFLLEFGIAALAGIVLCAKPITSIIDRFPIVSMFFFIGLVFGSIPMLYKKAKVEKFSWVSILWFLLGALIVISMEFLPAMESASEVSGFSFTLLILQLFAGVAVAVGFILPGISTSYLLLILGVYRFIMNAIDNLDIISLLPFIVGFILGVLLLTRFLDWCMRKYPGITYLIILGFLVGSVIPIYPGNPQGLEILYSVIAFAIGAVLIYFVSKKESDMESGKDA